MTGHWVFRGVSDSAIVFPTATLTSQDMSKMRPVVVIDPDDTEQVERLYDAYVKATGVHRMQARVGEFAAALREFADPTPPKPDEPHGRYAVVVDSDGVEWTNGYDGAGSWTSQNCTPTTPAAPFEMRRYADIAAVRVLSEGVTE